MARLPLASEFISRPSLRLDARRRAKPPRADRPRAKARVKPCAVATASCRRPLVFDAGNERVERGPELIAQGVALHHDFMLGAVDHDQAAGA